MTALPCGPALAERGLDIRLGEHRAFGISWLLAGVSLTAPARFGRG